MTGDGGWLGRRWVRITLLVALSVAVLLGGRAALQADPDQPPATQGAPNRTSGEDIPPGSAPTTTAATSTSQAPAAASHASSDVPPGPLEPAELARAAEVARKVALGYATWRFDDPPDAAARRLEGLVTEDLASRLASGSSAAAGRATHTSRRERAAAVVTGLRLRLIATESVVVEVAARQTITATGGQRAHDRRYAITVVPDGSGWAASDLTDIDVGDLGG
jgi:hypothetical protein